MQKVSQRFLDGLRSTHRVVSYVDLYKRGSTSAITLPVVSGSVSCDRTQDVRRTGTVTFAVPNKAATLAYTTLNPYDTYAIVRRGIRFADGVEETVDLGFFTIDSVQWNEDETSIEAELSDLTALAQRALLVPKRTVTSTSTLATIAALLADIWRVGAQTTTLPPADTNQWLTVDANVVDKPLSAYAMESDDRWGTVAELANNLGAEIYADPSAQRWRVVLVPLTAETRAVSWTIDSGDTGVLTSFTREVSGTEVVNAVYATGDDSGGDGFSVSAGAWAYDNDPASPTYVGSYGWAIEVITSSAYVSTDQCLTAAKTYLASNLGLANSLDLASIPNPALEAGDVIRVNFPDGGTEKHVIDALNIGLSPDDDFTVTTRQVSGVPTKIS